jgi:hypothetical protein
VSEPDVFSQIKISDLRRFNRPIEAGQWSVVSVHDQQEFRLSLTPGWVEEGAVLALDQAYAIVTPTWVLMLSDFDRLCVLLMGGAALHPDPEIRLRLLISLSIQIQKVLGVVQCEIMPVKNQTDFSALWLLYSGTGLRDPLHYRCAAEVRHENQIVSGFLALLVCRSDPRKIFATVSKNHYRFKCLTPNSVVSSCVKEFRKNELPGVCQRRCPIFLSGNSDF